MMSNPLVSVCMIAYGHENYIRQAIESVLTQKTTFPIELIISEDCGPDNTRKIVEEYAARYGDIIVADLPKSNRGVLGNFNHNMGLAKGKYIALCEGDDYWTDPLKLQKQVDFLEANPDYSFCFHNATIHYEDGCKADHIFADFNTGEFERIQLVRNWIAPTASFVFRKTVYDSDMYRRVSLSKKLVVGDTPLAISASYCGRIWGMKESMSIYRKHSGGAMNTFDARLLKLCRHAIEMKKIAKKDLRSLHNKSIGEYAAVGISKIIHGDILLGLKLTLLAVCNAPVRSIKTILFFSKKRR